jgi:hypothetical protein
MSKLTPCTVTAQLLSSAHSKHSACHHYFTLFVPQRFASFNLPLSLGRAAMSGKSQDTETFPFLCNECTVISLTTSSLHFLLPSVYFMLQISLLASPSSLILCLWFYDSTLPPATCLHLIYLAFLPFLTLSNLFDFVYYHYCVSHAFIAYNYTHFSH